MNSEILKLLSSVPFFRGLETELLTEIASQTRRRRLPRGFHIFHEGEPGQKLYLVISGHVHIEKTSASGQTVHIGTCSPGEHFGELALIDGAPRMADAVTAEPCELLELDRQRFIRCIEAAPRIALAVMASLAQRLRASGDNLVTRHELDVRGRLARVLLQLAEIHGRTDSQGIITIAAKFTHQELANQAGTTRESITRALGQLRRSHTLGVQGRTLILLDVGKLRRISQV